MQFEPDEYPVYDYKFTAASSLGIMAREYEVTQLVQLLQTMGKDSPMYLPLIGSVIDNMNISNRQELLEQIKQMQQPDEAAQQQAQEAAKAAAEFQQAQTGMVAAQGKESTARAFKYMEEAKSIPKELEIDKIRAITANLDTGEQDDREFSRRLQTADRYLKDKELNIKQQAGREALQMQGNTMVPQVPQSLPEQLPAESQGMPQGLPQE